MAHNWPRVEIADVCELIVDCVNKTAPQVTEPTPFYMIRTPHIKQGRINVSDFRYVTEETYKKWTRRAKVEVGDVLLTREAPLGEVAMVRESRTWFLGQRVLQYRADREKLDPTFLLYSFLSPDLQTQFHSHGGSGSTVDHIRVPDCSKFKLNLPPLPEQKAIAGVLGSLDDKIELNRRINASLEAMAQALFKSWFVDFDPVRAKSEGRAPSGMDEATAALFPSEFEQSTLGSIPKGWEIQPMSSVIEVNPRRTLAAGTIAPYVDMKNMPTEGHSVVQVVARKFSSGTKFKNGDTLLARITPCLENGKTAFVDCLKDGETGWGSTEYIVLRPKPPLPVEFGYYLARSSELRVHAIQSMVGTSGRQRVPSSCFDQFEIAVPTRSVTQYFGQIVGLWMTQIKANHNESTSLVALRDSLLPKLLTGVLRVQ